MALTYLCLNLTLSLVAQTSIDTLINTEMKFAKLAMDKSVKEAFLSYLDSNGVVFNNGIISNGIKIYQKQPVNKTKIIWEPSYSIISTSGELGINTGPFQYFVNDTAQKPLVQGQFTTLWHKTKAGEWKFLVDMGISFRENVEMPVKNIRKKILPASRTDLKPSTDTDVLIAEESFIKSYKKRGAKCLALLLAMTFGLTLMALHH